ncbi:DUF5623 domain-containing protein [Dyella ginsengisoli]|uniref:DUF5623 domain-containing protein n=1 Tax=Dyella ginsengisoli TaxID=363848 RepID=UPI0003722D24|nr:DUF5623 domain-containing protein [Dyella ginsengisoli]
MADVSIHPSTLAGIKRLAKSISRERGITHTAALSAAAQAAGFENFSHARRVLAAQLARPGRSTLRTVYITAYWRSREGSGRETAVIGLPSPLDRLLTPVVVRSLHGRFRLDAADHVEATEDVLSKGAALDAVTEAARRLAFMAATGLRPGNALAPYLWSLDRRVDKLPGLDHPSYWYLPRDKSGVIIDEPYNHFLLQERMEFLKGSGVHVALAFERASRGGRGLHLHSSATSLYVITDDEKRLARLVRSLEGCNYMEAMKVESAPYEPLFVSPARAALKKRKQGRPQLLPLDRPIVRRNALAYQVMPGQRVEWRPAARLPLAGHRQIARLLVALLGCDEINSASYSALQNAHATLARWLRLEFPPTLRANADVDLLYFGAKASDRQLPAGMTAENAVVQLLEALRDGYPDCGPLRKVMRPLETVLRRLRAKAARTAQLPRQRQVD